MPTTLRCPACSAPLNLPGPLDAATRCPYCGAGVLLASGHGPQPGPAYDPHAGIDPEVIRLVQKGMMIQAIKLHRERTGLGLKEAKDAIDRIAANLPGGAPRPTAGRGCVIFPILVVVAIALLMWRGPRPDGERPAPVQASAPSPASAQVPAFAAELLRFGSEGTGAGRFTDARSVAVDGAGRIYVAEYQGGRVQVFDSAGTFVTQWMADPEMPLVDMEAGRDGTVYISQSGRIRRYDGATGDPRGEVARRDRWTSYSAMALGLDGTVWALMGGLVLRIGRDGVRPAIDITKAVGESASPARVAVAGTGDVYVLDRVSGEVYRFGADGRFMDRFGGRGEGAESTHSPEDIAIDGRGRVYVSDLGQGIRVFDAGGRFIGEFGGREVVFGLDVNDRDEVFGAFRNRHQVARFRLNR